jgi:hypothetical protein
VFDENEFKKYLKKSGRKNTAIVQITTYISEFEKFYSNRYQGNPIEDVSILDLEDFVADVESASKGAGKKPLWALWYLFDFLGREELCRTASEMRAERIKKIPFKLERFMEVNQKYTDILKGVGIENVNQILDAGRNPELRQELASRTGIPLDYIVELVKLSDLTRIGAVRSVRARLYFSAGVDTPEKMAEWDPTELREMLLGFIEESGFQGIAPLPKEARNAVADAKKLKSIIDY